MLTPTWAQKQSAVSQQPQPKSVPGGVRGEALSWESFAKLAYWISWLIFVCNNCIKKIMRVGFFLVLAITMANMLRRFRQKCDFTSNDNYFWTELQFSSLIRSVTAFSNSVIASFDDFTRIILLFLPLCILCFNNSSDKYARQLITFCGSSNVNPLLCYIDSKITLVTEPTH